MAAADDARAAAYRASLAARERFLTELQDVTLAGDDAAAQSVRDAWSPARDGIGIRPVDEEDM